MKDRFSLRHLFILVILISLLIMLVYLSFFSRKLNYEIKKEIRNNSNIILKEIESNFSNKILREIVVTKIISSSSYRRIIELPEIRKTVLKNTAFIYILNNECKISKLIFIDQYNKNFLFPGMDLSNFPFCKFIMKNYKNFKIRETKISNPYYDPLSGKILISIIVKIKNGIYVRNLYLNSLLLAISKKDYFLKKIVLIVKRKTNVILFNSSPEKIPIKKIDLTDEKLVLEDKTEYILSKANLKNTNTMLLILIPITEYKSFRILFYNFIIFTLSFFGIIIILFIFMLKNHIVSPLSNFTNIMFSTQKNIVKIQSIKKIKSIFKEFNILKNNYINELNREIKIKETLSEVGFGLIIYNSIQGRIRIFDINSYVLKFFNINSSTIKTNEKTRSLKINNKKLMDFLKNILYRVKENPKKKKFRYIYRYKKEKVYYLEISWDEIIYSGVKNYFMLFRDITNDVITEERLFQSQKLEIIGQLSGGIAHDFNNILSIIVGNLELARKSDDIEYIKEKLDKTFSASQRASDLIKQLLTLSKKDEILDKEIISMNDLLLETLDLARKITKGIRISYENRAKEDKVYAEYSLLSSSIMNFIINAKDAIIEKGIAEGKILVYLKEKTFMKRKYVSIVIKDNGVGIELENIKKIFDPFFTTKPRGKGTGLGLSVTLSYIKKLGGEINVFSEKGRGTEFEILIPLSCADKDSKLVKPLKKLDLELNNYNYLIKNLKVLIVDDEIDIREATKNLFKEEFGINADLASNGTIAYDKILKNNYDFVLLDVIMPDLRGDQVIEKLEKEIKEIRSIIYILTGFIEEGMDYLLKSKLIRKIIIKPIDLKKIKEILIDFINMKKEEKNGERS